MDDQTNDVPQASGLDEWWKRTASDADVADREKQAIAAEDFQAQRVQTYLESGGEADIGGFVRPNMMARSNDYSKWPRMISWRYG